MVGAASRDPLPETVPLFPLSGALLLPHAHLPLRVFEPRYIAMLEDTLKTPQRLIGMIQPLATPEGLPDGKLQHIGCAGRIVSFNENEDGIYRIALRGVSRFRLLEHITDGAPYGRGRVDWSSFSADMAKMAPDEGFDRDVFLAVLERYLSINKLSSDMKALHEADEELLVNSLSILNPFEPEDKQALLEAPTLANRRETLMMLMRFAMDSKAAKGSIH